MFVCKDEIAEQWRERQNVAVRRKCVSGCTIISWSFSNTRRRKSVVPDASNVRYMRHWTNVQRDKTMRSLPSLTSLTLIWCIMIMWTTTRRWWQTSGQWWMNHWRFQSQLLQSTSPWIPERASHRAGLSLTLVYSSTNMSKSVWTSGFWKPLIHKNMSNFWNHISFLVKISLKTLPKKQEIAF